MKPFTEIDCFQDRGNKGAANWSSSPHAPSRFCRPLLFFPSSCTPHRKMRAADKLFVLRKSEFESICRAPRHTHVHGASVLIRFIYVCIRKLQCIHFAAHSPRGSFALPVNAHASRVCNRAGARQVPFIAHPSGSGNLAFSGRLSRAPSKEGSCVERMKRAGV